MNALVSSGSARSEITALIKPFSHFIFFLAFLPALPGDAQSLREPERTQRVHSVGPERSEHSEAERLLFDSANRERAALHLQPLTWDESLAKAARLHAVRMAQQKRLEHQLRGEPALDQRAAQAAAHFSKIGENIAVGPRPSTIHTGWMHSPPHRANILDPQFTVLGVGVVQARSEEHTSELQSQR